MNCRHLPRIQQPRLRAHTYPFCTGVRLPASRLKHLLPQVPVSSASGLLQCRCSAHADSSSTNDTDKTTTTSVNSNIISTTVNAGSDGGSSEGRRVQLPPPCDLGGAAPQARWNAISLAYLGDAVWEAYLRSCFYGHEGLSDSQLMYNRGVAAKANAKAQSLCYLLLLSESWLTPAEVELTRWASNNSTVAPPKQVTRLEYKQATALEVLVAHLYLTDSQRLQQLIDWLLDPSRVSLWHSDTQQPQVQPQARRRHSSKQNRATGEGVGRPARG